MMALLASLLQLLQPMMPDMGAQAVSNILWSSAKLGLHLDSLALGVTQYHHQHHLRCNLPATVHLLNYLLVRHSAEIAAHTPPTPRHLA